MERYTKHISKVAILLLLGGVLLSSSCKKKFSDSIDPERFITERSDSLTVIVSENGFKKYRFKTPQAENYGLAKEPYMEHPKGLYVETFKDSTQVIESTLKANYAIYYKKRKLWEARGDVVATGADGRALYTQQLFWDERTQRVYSNVTSKIVQDDGEFIGEGFESDDKLEDWTFRNYVGEFSVNVSGNEEKSDKVDTTESGSDSENTDNTPSSVTEEPINNDLPRRRPKTLPVNTLENNEEFITPVSVDNKDDEEMFLRAAGNIGFSGNIELEMPQVDQSHLTDE